MIDFHVHVTPPDIAANWQKYAKKEKYFALLSNSRQNKFASAEDVIAALGKARFDKAVVFGFAFRDIGLCRYVNDYVIEKVKEHPDKLIGFCVVPPSKHAEKEIERCYNAGLKGAGELFPAGQGVNLTDKKQTAPITGACAETGIPLLLHVNEPVGHDYAGKTDVPLKHIETFARNNPDLKIILAHFGGGLFFYETMPEIRKSFANVYYDTAAAPFLYDARVYGAVNALGLCGKLLFGSDYPLLEHARYMDAINKSALTEEEKQMILGGNAIRILSAD